MFLRNRRGQGMTEYIIIVAIIALAALAAFKLFGSKLRGSIGKAGQTLEQGVDDGVNETDDGLGGSSSGTGGSGQTK